MKAVDDLLAVVAEDRQVAIDAERRSSREWAANGAEVRDVDDVTILYASEENESGRALVAHVVTWSPDRVRRETEVRRRLIRRIAAGIESSNHEVRLYALEMLAELVPPDS